MWCPHRYNQVFLCYDFPDSWTGNLYLGAWDPAVPTSSHGGCPKHATFPNNPQFGFKVPSKTSFVIVRQPLSQVGARCIDLLASGSPLN